MRLLQQSKHVCEHACRGAARGAGSQQRRRRRRVRRRRAQLGQRVAVRRAPSSGQDGGRLPRLRSGRVLRLSHLDLQRLEFALNGAPHSLKLSC